MTRKSSALVRAPVSDRPIARPQGEQVGQHTGLPEEESGSTLANRRPRGVTLPSPRERENDTGVRTRAGDLVETQGERCSDETRVNERKNAPLTNEVETQEARAAEVETQGPAVDVDERIKIVRATTRLAIDLRRKQDAPDRESADTMQALLLDTAIRSARAANAVVRACYLLDCKSFDELPNKDEIKGWKLPKLNAYALARAAAPELDTGIASAVARKVLKKYTTSRWDVFVRQSRAPDHYRWDGAFPCRAQEVEVKERKVERKRRMQLVYDVSARLTAGKGQRVTWEIEPRDDHQQNVLHKLAAGEWKHGDVLVERDRRKRRVWYLRVSYTRFIPKAMPGQSAAINRGIKTALAAVAESGAQWLYDGWDIEQHLRAIKHQRRKYQNDSKASSRWGRGRKRTLRPIERIEEAGHHWRRTKNQTIARRFREWLAEQNVSRLYVEDFTGIRDGTLPERLDGGKPVWDRIQEWPTYDLLQRLTACCNEPCTRRDGTMHGAIEVVVRSASYDSQTCPKCNAIDASHCDRQAWRLVCRTGCKKYSRHLDIGAAANHLRNGEFARKGLASLRATGSYGSSDSDKLREKADREKESARKTARKGSKSEENGETGGDSKEDG